MSPNKCPPCFEAIHGARGAEVLVGYEDLNRQHAMKPFLGVRRGAVSVLYLLVVLCATCLGSEPGVVSHSWRRIFPWSQLRLARHSPCLVPESPFKDDTPVRKVYVHPFSMDEAEVTNRAGVHICQGYSPQGALSLV